jgi:hypothetical protein
MREMLNKSRCACALQVASGRFASGLEVPVTPFDRQNFQRLINTDRRGALIT